MTDSHHADAILIQRIRAGDQDAWSDLIARYEGRLLAFVRGRVRRQDVCEDIVQETFLGLLNSLPNYDGSRPLETYLFTICAYKLTDYLRREGRRPALPLSQAAGDSQVDWQPASSERVASSIARSGERRQLEEKALVEALTEQIQHWRKRQDWVKIQCMELLFVRGKPNKTVAQTLGITEQQVANFKFDFLARLRTLIQRQGVSQDVFPELHQFEG